MLYDDDDDDTDDDEMMTSVIQVRLKVLLSSDRLISVLLQISLQVETGVEDAHHDQADERVSDDQVGPDDDEDNVSEISGLSDVSISGAGRWHPMQGLSHATYCVSYFSFWCSNYT